MSNERRGKQDVLNWRGPLLAAVVFGSVFGALLLMAHLNEAKTSDEGSSFRQDPYGTSLLFGSYERAGYHVTRSQDEKSLAEQDASRTTAFFIGGYDYRDVETRDRKIIRGAKFHALLEEFLIRGGRVVLLEHESAVSVASLPSLESAPKPGGFVAQKEKSWGVESVFDSAGKHESGPAWAEPAIPAMPAESEPMYLGADAPWLKVEPEWGVLYRGPVNRKPTDAGSSAHVYLAMRQVGKGELVVASQQSFLLNEAIKTHPNPVLLDFLTGGRTLIWVDETLHGLHQDEGVLWLVRRYRLQAALLLFWTTLLALLWSMSGDLIRRPARNRSAEIVRQAQAASVAGQRLLQRSIAPEQVVAECWDQFRRRSPRDAEAISADRRWGPRLRAALAQSPLAGYKALAQIVAERRTLARGMAHGHSGASRGSLDAPKTIPGEA